MQGRWSARWRRRGGCQRRRPSNSATEQPFLRLRSDVRHRCRLLVAHHAVALEDGPFLDDQRRRLDIAVDLSVAMDLDPLCGDDLADDGSADSDPSNMNIALDVRALSDDQFVLRHDLAVETAVDAHRVFELQLAATRSA